jgi:HEAT repeat protein
MKQNLAIAALGSVALAAVGADSEQAVNDLIPKLADPKVENRYSAQMALQDIASNASKPGSGPAREALGKVLATKAADTSVPQPARVWIVRQLENMGGAEAVGALTKVMNGGDAELRECARRALEKNSAPAATAPLRAALEKASDATWRIGLMNSLGQRGDAGSVKLIAAGLGDAKTAPAAALALGNIANAPAVEALWGALNRTPEAGEALIVVANQMKAKGDAAAATVIYERVAKEAKSKSLQAAAESGLKAPEAAQTPAKKKGRKKAEKKQ